MSDPLLERTLAELVPLFGQSEKHVLLGRRYPLTERPLPRWGDPQVLGRNAGRAEIATGTIELNPEYLDCPSRINELRDVLKHEMLHVYVYFWFGCRGHEQQWGSIASAIGCTQYHCLTKIGAESQPIIGGIVLPKPKIIRLPAAITAGQFAFDKRNSKKPLNLP